MWDLRDSQPERWEDFCNHKAHRIGSFLKKILGKKQKFCALMWAITVHKSKKWIILLEYFRECNQNEQVKCLSHLFVSMICIATKSLTNNCFLWNNGINMLNSNYVKCFFKYSFLLLEKWKWKSLSRVWLFETPLDSVESSRPEYWSGEPFSSPGNLPNPGFEHQVPCISVGFFISWATREAQEYKIKTALYVKWTSKTSFFYQKSCREKNHSLGINARSCFLISMLRRWIVIHII